MSLGCIHRGIEQVGDEFFYEIVWLYLEYFFTFRAFATGGAT